MKLNWVAILPPFIREKIAGRLTLQQAIANTGWLFADRIFRISLEFFVNVWLIRYLTPEQFGLYSYAIAFVALFEPLANFGIDQIVVRDIAKKIGTPQQILSTVFILKAFSSTLALFLSIAAILYLRPDDYLGQRLVIIIGITLLFKVFDTVDLWFQSQIQSQYIVITKNIAFLISILVKIFLIVSKAPLVAFAYLILGEVILAKSVLIIVYNTQENAFSVNRFNWSQAKKIFKDSFLLMLSGVAILVYMRIDQIMLGQMAGTKAVGIYSVAVKLSESWFFLPMAITNSALPIIADYHKNNPQLYEQKLHELFKVAIGLTYLVAIPCTLFSRPIINILFGTDYTASATILSLHIWSGLFVCLGLVRNLWVISENFTGFAFTSTTTGAIINLGLNLILIPPYGAIGATVATLISYAISSYLLGFLFSKTRKITYLMTKSLFFA